MMEQVSDTDWCMMRPSGEQIPTVDFCNGAVMTFDDNGKMISRRGGLFWTMECKYNNEGDVIEYTNEFGYTAKREWVAKIGKYVLKWKTPKNDVFSIGYQLSQRKKLLKDLKAK